MVADAEAADLLVHTPMEDGASLLQWIYENIRSHRGTLLRMVPALRPHLARRPLEEWSTDMVSTDRFPWGSEISPLAGRSSGMLPIHAW